jgi:lactate permease
MRWTQVIDPFHNIALSALVAVLPILFIFWALIIKKMKGYKASLFAVLIALLIAVFIYGMPVRLALLSSMHGALYGVFPICWIVVTAVYLFNITVKSGQLEIIKHFMASITSDRRLQALLIAFSFGSFLEGMAGFGAPVAITAAMLVGLGFNPLYAAGICLIANTVPVAFGSIGIPVTVAAQVSGIPEMAISQMVGRTLPLLSLFIPLYLVVLICGFKKSIGVLPAILVSGISFALLQWFASNYLSPMLPDVLAGIGSIIALIILLKYWKPKNIWRFKDESIATPDTQVSYSSGQIMKAFSPFIILTVMVIAWGLQPVKETLNSIGLIQFEVPGLHNAIQLSDGKLLPQIFKANFLSAAGTAILLSAIISLPLIGVAFKDGSKIFGATLKQLAFPIVTVAAVLCFAYVLNNAGISNTMAKALANTGRWFPFFAPILGWLGVFITGSDTSANALFGKLQYATAVSIGVDPVLTVGANVSGGVVGKMISPQSIAIAAAAGNLVGKESDLFRFTVKHSFIMLFLICLLTLGQAYLFSRIIPSYAADGGSVATHGRSATSGPLYLAILAVVLIVIATLVMRVSNNKKAQPKEVEMEA